MSEPILHHYPNSPFAEKIRLILGYKQLAWQSVHIPMIMPKPDVVALTGGYRKTPILQVGADIYCDTALIADVLEHLQPQPTLYPPTQKGVARVLAQWADTTLFATAMAHNSSAKGAAQVFGAAPPETAQAFADDRSRMRQGAPRLPAPDAAAAYRSYLRRLANMLHQQPYLLGDAPCLADFAAYHPLWFTRDVTSVLADVLEHTPAVLKWMDRIARFGAAAHAPLQATQAISIAAGATPAAVRAGEFQDDHGIALGTQVTIASESFGLEPTQGELLAATRMHYTLRRVDARAGTVHVHFPRIGYVMRRAP